MEIRPGLRLFGLHKLNMLAHSLVVLAQRQLFAFVGFVALYTQAEVALGLIDRNHPDPGAIAFFGHGSCL